MVKKIIYSLSLLILFSSSTQAGIVELTIHSRANCVNNESITWDLRWYRKYMTASEHFCEDKAWHHFKAEWEDTWRSAAVHWGEAYPGDGWEVQGEHWMEDYESKEIIYLGRTKAVDCSIYNGWWD